MFFVMLIIPPISTFKIRDKEFKVIGFNIALLIVSRTNMID